MALSSKLSVSFFILTPLLAIASSESKDRDYINKNVIDKCWRNKPDWASSRKDLAWCSIGYTGKVKKLAGSDVKYYEVTDSSDNPEKPKEGTLRYGATTIPGKVWITFKGDMTIKLNIPIFISNLTAIDGRGATVHIAGGSGLVVDKACILYYRKLQEIPFTYIFCFFKKSPYLTSDRYSKPLSL